MSMKINTEDVNPETIDHLRVWKLLPTDEHGIRTGLVEYGTTPEDPALGGSHETPEYFYVVSGQGMLLEEDERLELRAGDGFSIPAGRRHVIWGNGDEPFTVFYVAMASNGATQHDHHQNHAHDT